MTDLSLADRAIAPTPVSRRARLVDAVAELCEAAPRDRSAAADTALAQAMLKLVADAEHAVRQRLAERLAAADWAPHDLVAALALDEIEVARPLLAQSPVLRDDDLLRVLAEAQVEHRVAVARRPLLSPAVADRASADSETIVLAALASNENAELPASAMARLMAAAKRAAELRGPLARRRELDPELALQLYAFVGEGLRATLSQRFALPADRLSEAVSEAVASVGGGVQAGERDEMERRLVEKLQGSGQLRPGFLVKSLRDGRLSLFEVALSALCEAPRGMIATAVRGDDPRRLALACAAAGVDRGAFPTLLSLVRRITGGQPGESGDSAARVKAAFALPDPRAARAEFLASDVE